MRVLAFDTSTPDLSVAVLSGEKILAEVRSDTGARHSSSLAPAIEEALKKARLKVTDLDGIVVGLGPGSFTGLRVGVSTAQLLAYSLGIPVAGVPSPAAAARALEPCDRVVAVLQDAKRGQVYASAYAWKGGRFVTLQAPRLADGDAFVRALPGGTHVLGDISPSAATLGKLALESGRKAFSKNPMNIAPLYVRPKDCNVVLHAKAKKR